MIRRQFYIEKVANWVENGIICNSKAQIVLDTFIMYFCGTAFVSIISAENACRGLSETPMVQFFLKCLLLTVSRGNTFVICCVYNCDNLVISPYTTLSEPSKHEVFLIVK